MTYGKAVQDELRPHARDLRRMIPEIYDGFGALSQATLADGALDIKTKELIALALSVGHGCDGCIAAHAKGAAKQGAHPAEVAEAIGVTFLLQGGPATAHGPRAYNAFLEFYGELHPPESPESPESSGSSD